jgi:hypothetical protein
MSDAATTKDGTRDKAGKATLSEEERKENDAARLEYFDQYWQYASNLRTWFIAYGVGGIVFLTRADAAFNRSGSWFDPAVKIEALYCCFIGLLAQVFLAAINKVAHFYAYQRALWVDEGLALKRRHKAALRVCSWFSIDVTLDGITAIAFLYATLLLTRLV